MMKPVARMDGRGANALQGRVVWSPAKSLWNMVMLACTIGLAPLTITPGAVLLFFTTTYCSLLLGHSVGMHRRFIHRSYSCRKWLERALVYIGVLVGVAGPFGILRVHDERDWAQRQHACHDFFAHRRSPLVDLWWQLNCRFEFTHPPVFSIEPEVAEDRWYRFLERSWMLQQLPVALVCYSIGGWSWVVWGVAARVCISVIGHWSITYWCHNPGSGRWRVQGASVQATNLRGLGVVTFGECWHNNHHAFPESARIGLEKGQTDPAAWIIEVLAKLSWTWNLGVPRPQWQREDLEERAEDRGNLYGVPTRRLTPDCNLEATHFVSVCCDRTIQTEPLIDKERVMTESTAPATRHRDVLAAEGGERRAKITLFARSNGASGKEPELPIGRSGR